MYKKTSTLLNGFFSARILLRMKEGKKINYFFSTISVFQVGPPLDKSFSENVVVFACTSAVKLNEIAPSF